MPHCPNCALPMSLADGAHLAHPYWTCDGPNDNTKERGCFATLAVTATLLRDVTAQELAMDSPDPDEGYQPGDVIGPSGSTVTITDSDYNLIEVEGFANDPFASGFIPRDALQETL